MRDANSLVKLLALSVFLAGACAHRSSRERSERAERPEHDCEVRFIRYRLDREPAEYGLRAGYYDSGKKAYVGLGIWQNMVLSPGRIQLDPPGLWRPNVNGNGIFDNGKQIWYLSPRSGQKFAWVRSRDGRREKFAIDIGTESGGLASYIGRIRVGSRTFLGAVVDGTKSLHYVDGEGLVKTVRSGYDVLTCQTCRDEKKIPLPKITPPQAPPTADNGCYHNWVPYTNDDEPASKGISAGAFACGNEAYVGKGKPSDIFVAGRIQTVGDAGLYAFRDNADEKLDGENFYLADNHDYTYKWVDYTGAVPSNAVVIRNDNGAFEVGVGRISVNGRVRIGSVVQPVLAVINDKGDGIDYLHNFEILVCDPFPKFLCGQQWKTVNAEAGDSPTVDGFAVGDGRFVARVLQKCINGCDFSVGVFETARGGVSYLDELRTEGAFESTAFEYLVGDASYSYRWKVSRNGAKVPNALELQREGHAPFYVGRTRINDDVFVGKVRPGEGLFFVDRDGHQRSASSYDVLTCGSPYPHDGLYEERSDWSWYGDFGCPVRKEWSFQKWRCVCRDEFKGFLAGASGTWSEDTCSYV